MHIVFFALHPPHRQLITFQITSPYCKEFYGWEIAFGWEGYFRLFDWYKSAPHFRLYFSNSGIEQENILFSLQQKQQYQYQKIVDDYDHDIKISSPFLAVSSRLLKWYEISIAQSCNSFASTLILLIMIITIIISCIGKSSSWTNSVSLSHKYLKALDCFLEASWSFRNFKDPEPFHFKLIGSIQMKSNLHWQKKIEAIFFLLCIKLERSHAT